MDSRKRVVWRVGKSGDLKDFGVGRLIGDYRMKVTCPETGNTIPSVVKKVYDEATKTDIIVDEVIEL